MNRNHIEFGPQHEGRQISAEEYAAQLEATAQRIRKEEKAKRKAAKRSLKAAAQRKARLKMALGVLEHEANHATKSEDRIHAACELLDRVNA